MRQREREQWVEYKFSPFALFAFDATERNIKLLGSIDLLEFRFRMTLNDKWNLIGIAFLDMLALLTAHFFGYGILITFLFRFHSRWLNSNWLFVRFDWLINWLFYLFLFFNVLLFFLIQLSQASKQTNDWIRFAKKLLHPPLFINRFDFFSSPQSLSKSSKASILYRFASFPGQDQVFVEN